MAQKKSKVVKKRNTLAPGLLVSDRVELKDVRLLKSECNINIKALSGKKTYSIRHSADFNIDRECGVIIVVPHFEFEAFAEGEPENQVLTINASFLLYYSVKDFEGLTKKGFEQFANLNGIYNAWPYWREFVQNTIARMGLPPLAIPVFRIVEQTKKKF